MGRNNKARFRGDVQIDGQVLGSDGEPIDLGGGGSFDWATPIPELYFAGDPSDDASGISIAWDEDLWGLVFKGPPGSGDAELYLVDPDDPDGNRTNLWPGSSSFHGADGTQGSYGSNQASVSGPYGTTNINTGGMSFYGPNEGGVNIGAGGASFNADPAMFVGDELIKRRYFSFGYNDESGSRFSITPDGELGWNDGSDFVHPDVTLERTADGVYSDVGVGDLRIPGHHALLMGDLDADYSLGGGYISYSDAYWQETGGDNYGGVGSYGASWRKLRNDASGTSGIDLGFDGTVDHAPHLSMSGKNGDFLLQADALSYFTINHNVSDSGWEFWRREADGSFGAAPQFSFTHDGLIRWNNDVSLQRHAAGMLEITQSGGGLVLHSPDGTAYKLTPPNGGGPAEWVAA